MKHSCDCSATSSMLNGSSYDDETKELTVTFKNGKDYVYVDVDKSTFDLLESAPSAGKAFNVIKAGLTQK